MTASQAFMAEGIANQFTVLLLGETGDGKTSLACTFPKIHLYSLDTNVKNAMRYYKRTGFVPDIVSYSIPDGKEPYDEYFQRANEELFVALNNPEVETIVFDNLTRWSDFELEALKRRFAGNSNKYAVYDAYLTSFVRMMGLFMSVSKTVITIGHYEAVNDDNGIQIYRPYLHGKSQKVCATYYGETWRTYIDKDTKERKLQLFPSTRYPELKNSLGEVDDIVIPSDPKDIYHAIAAKYNFHQSV